MATVVSINISKVRGVMKEPIKEANLIVDFGIEGDAHAGNWHRQISLLAKESIDFMVEKGLLDPKYGMFAENITTEGIEVHKLPVGTKLQLGEAIVEVTQIGKECHQHCQIYHKVGDCVMPREGIFVKVLKPGKLYIDDEVTIIE